MAGPKHNVTPSGMVINPQILSITGRQFAEVPLEVKNFANSLQLAVGAVAESYAPGMFAAAPRHGLGLGNFHFVRRKAGALVRTVAERLALGKSADTPPIRARFNPLHEWPSLSYDGFIHVFFLAPDQARGNSFCPKQNENISSTPPRGVVVLLQVPVMCR